MQPSKNKRSTAVSMLLGLTMVWGTTFAIVQKALPDISPAVYGILRFGAASILFFVVSRSSRLGLRMLLRPRNEEERTLRTMSLVLGSALGAGYILQTMGLETTSTSKSAFLTATTVIWTPLLSRVISRVKFSFQTIAAIVISVVGIVLLTRPYPVEHIVIGDIYSVLCAVSFGIYIYQLDRVMPKYIAYEGSERGGVMASSAVQLLISTLFIGFFLPFSEIRLVWSGTVVFALLYTTLLTTAISTYIQSMYQKEITPTAAVLIYTLEPVSALIIAYLFMNEKLTGDEMVGAALIIGGMLLGQWNGKDE